MSKSTVGFIIGKIIQGGIILVGTAFGAKKGYDSYKSKPKNKSKK